MKYLNRKDYLHSLYEICKKQAISINNVVNYEFNTRTPNKVQANKFILNYLYYSLSLPFNFTMTELSSLFNVDRTTLYHYKDSHFDHLKFITDYKLKWNKYKEIVDIEKDKLKVYPELLDNHEEFDELAGLYEYDGNHSIHLSELKVHFEIFIKKNQWHILRCANYVEKNYIEKHKSLLKYYIDEDDFSINLFTNSLELAKEIHDRLFELEDDWYNSTGINCTFFINDWELYDPRELFGGKPLGELYV
jgi:hypothetical protein